MKVKPNWDHIVPNYHINQHKHFSWKAQGHEFDNRLNELTTWA